MTIVERLAAANASAGTPAAQGGPAYPDYLKVEKPPYKPVVSRVAVDRYFKRAYHDLEVERIWKKAWQWACREEEIPEIGDFVIYDVAQLSFIVVRTGVNEFKAYWNACLHRGRKLCDIGGKRAKEFRCMFHGWSWDINGVMNNMTCGWDFPGAKEEVQNLPAVKTAVWGGFVFINPDPQAEPLSSFLGELPAHFEGAGHDFSKRWKQVHVLADLAANWKVVQEAFLESWHAATTHPQFVRPKDRYETRGMRWDDFGNWMRAAPALPTDRYKTPPGWANAAETDQQVINQHWDFHLNEEPAVLAQEGRSVTDVINEKVRQGFRRVIGDKIDAIHDIDLSGSELVHVWPNFHPWAGYSRLVYRFRPHRSGDPNRSLMDVVLISPWPDDRPRPPPAPVHVLRPDQPISDAPELGQLARVFLQDIANMPQVQEGLKSLRRGYVLLSKHNEAPVRHFNDLYDKWMGFADGDYLAGQTAASTEVKEMG